jgi:hypothetical protein
MPSVLLVDDSLRDDIHNSMIMIATTLGLIASSMIGGGILLMVKGLRNCPPCTPYEATCSTACVGCPTTCTTRCYSCQSGKSKELTSVVVATDQTSTTTPADVSISVSA